MPRQQGKMMLVDCPPPVPVNVMTRSLLRPILALAVVCSATPVLAQAPSQSLTGKWTFEVVTANGTGYPAVTLTQEGEKVTGTYSSSRGLRQIEGTVKGDKLTFTAKSPEPGGIDLEFTGTIARDGTISGSADFSGQGTATFTAKRAAP
jgi:hypothetical protein